jgi:hypothetical protein
VGYGPNRLIDIDKQSARLHASLQPLLPSANCLMFDLWIFMDIANIYSSILIPVHLNELSPDDARGTFPGFVYQLGNLIASFNATLQAGIALAPQAETGPRGGGQARRKALRET